MRRDQIIRSNARFIPFGNPQNTGKVLRRYPPALRPPINSDRLNIALPRYLSARTDLFQKCFDCFAHVPNNDYSSHKVKRLKQ